MKLIDLVSPIGILIIGTFFLAIGYVIFNNYLTISEATALSKGVEFIQIGLVMIVLSFVMSCVGQVFRLLKII